MTDFHPYHPARRHLHQSAGRRAGDSRASSASHLLSSINHRPSTLGPTISHQLPTLNYPLSTFRTLDSFPTAPYARIMQARQLAPRSSGRATTGLPAPNTTLSL